MDKNIHVKKLVHFEAWEHRVKFGLILKKTHDRLLLK